MPKEELVAVGGHEVGHLKHGGVHVILSILAFPMIFYFVGRMLISMARSPIDEERGRGSRAGLALLGAFMIIMFIFIYALVMFFNRLREYYADYHSAVVTKKPILLQRSLTRLYLHFRYGAKVPKKTSGFSMLMTVNPVTGKKTKKK